MNAGKMKRALLAAIALLAGAIGLFGESGEDLLGFYDTELIKVNYQSMGGLVLSYKGQTTGTAFGISKGFQDALGAYEDSAGLMRKYRTKNAVGNALMLGGLTISLVAAYYPILANDNMYDFSYSDLRNGLYLSLAGLIASLVGSFMLPSSYQDLFNSVNCYNRDKMAEY